MGGKTGCPTRPDGLDGGSQTGPNKVLNGGQTGSKRGPDREEETGQTGCPMGRDGVLNGSHVIGHVIFECHIIHLGWQGVILLPTLFSQL
jgi:hypothetical protein